MTNISPGDWLEKNVANSFRHMFFQVPFLKIDLEKVSETVKGLVEENAHTEKKREECWKQLHFLRLSCFPIQQGHDIWQIPMAIYSFLSSASDILQRPDWFWWTLQVEILKRKNFLAFLQPSTTSAYSSALILLTFIPLFFFTLLGKKKKRFFSSSIRPYSPAKDMEGYRKKITIRETGVELRPVFYLSPWWSSPCGVAK